jgi:hypothetical protein
VPVAHAEPVHGGVLSHPVPVHGGVLSHAVPVHGGGWQSNAAALMTSG